MKKPLIILTIALLCAWPLLAKPPQGSGRPPESAQNETRMLQHLLAMDPQDLAKLRQTIERIEQMSPEEKALLRERIGKLEKMKPENVEAMRQRFQAIPEETRETMRQRWLEMTPDERRDWRQKLRNMSQEERAEVFKEQGFLPAPGGKQSKGERPPPPPGNK